MPKAAYIQRHLTWGDFEHVRDYELEGEEGQVRHFHRVRCDELRQRIVEEHRIQELDAQEEIREEVVLPMTRTWLSYREFESLVRSEGYTVDAVFGDFDCNPLTNESREMIWSLRCEA